MQNNVTSWFTAGVHDLGNGIDDLLDELSPEIYGRSS